MTVAELRKALEQFDGAFPVCLEYDGGSQDSGPASLVRLVKLFGKTHVIIPDDTEFRCTDYP